MNFSVVTMHTQNHVNDLQTFSALFVSLTILEDLNLW
jgi:hypothetical protein